MRRLWLRDALALALLWGLACVLFGLALAWPYTNLLQTGSLQASNGRASRREGKAWACIRVAHGDCRDCGGCSRPAEAPVQRRCRPGSGLLGCRHPVTHRERPA